MKSLNNMTKKELDAYGETIGLTLDARKSKKSLIDAITEELNKQGKELPGRKKAAAKKAVVKKKAVKKKAVKKATKKAKAPVETIETVVQDDDSSDNKRTKKMATIVIVAIIVASIAANMA